MYGLGFGVWAYGCLGVSFQGLDGNVTHIFCQCINIGEYYLIMYVLSTLRLNSTQTLNYYACAHATYH